jgi:hypothetical protein
MPDEQVAIGHILILREEFSRVAASPEPSRGAIARAELLVRLLDELLQRREEEAAHVTGS